MVDGQLVLPPNYSSDSGETVILVYETPEGQQFMTEDGQPIVFQQVLFKICLILMSNLQNDNMQWSDI